MVGTDGAPPRRSTSCEWFDVLDSAVAYLAMLMAVPSRLPNIKHKTKIRRTPTRFLVNFASTAPPFFSTCCSLRPQNRQYNVFNAGEGRGDELYGVEPASFYVKNLLLNTSIAFPLAVALPFLALPLYPMADKVGVGHRFNGYCNPRHGEGDTIAIRCGACIVVHIFLQESIP